MKLSKLWNQLTRAQKREWSAWAKNNPLLLDDGNVRRVCGHKAMTIVLANRAMFGDAANPTVLPGTPSWLGTCLTTTGAGVDPTAPGYVGFRATKVVPSGTKLAVYASGLCLGDDPAPLASLRFLSYFNLALSPQDEHPTPNLATFYRATHGEFIPAAGEEGLGHWDPPRHVWFRIHEYYQGVLSPGFVLSCMVDYPA